MITCRLKGGLGNIMFQLAALEAMSIDSGIKSFYYNIDSQIRLIDNDTNHNPTVKHASKYLTMFKNFNWYKNHTSYKSSKTVNVPFHYTKIKPESGVCYDGFFQSEKFFKHKESYIRHMFEPSDDIMNYIKSKYPFLFTENITSLHVRRGDYLKLSHVLPPQTLEYYKTAIDIIGKDSKFLVFSDDMQWCKETFSGDNFIFSNEDDYIELFMMSFCKNNIMSNSSFSWWGSWLNKNQNKKVIAPKIWFAQEAINNKGWNPSDIIPALWQTI